MAKEEKGEKFPLIIYRRWAKMLRWPSLLIAIVSGVALWFGSDYPLLGDRAWLFLIMGCVGALIFLYSIHAHRASYVQCFPNYFKVRTPLLSVAVSYKRILQVRPVEFYTQLPKNMKRPQLRLLEPYLGYTVILLELNAFPVSERRLRRWLPWFMLAHDVAGFVLVVDDWMALSRQIGVFSDRWIARRRARERPMIGQRRY